MTKELCYMVAGVIGLVLLVGFGLYLGGQFMGEFLKYLLPFVVVFLLGKVCTNYLNRKSVQKKS